MKAHIAILEDLARNKANCRVIMRAEREALEAAFVALTSKADCGPQAYDNADPAYEPAAGEQLEPVREEEVVP